METGDKEKPKPKNQVVVVGTAHIFITPIGFHSYASEFFEAARAAKRPQQFSPVPYYLYCHSIELSLKSFLLCKGVSKQELKKKLMHNLDKIFDRACELGLRQFIEMSPDHQACLKEANKYYQAKRFEYFDLYNTINGYRDRPVLDVLDSLAELLLKQLEQCCAEAADNPPESARTT